MVNRVSDGRSKGKGRYAKKGRACKTSPKAVNPGYLTNKHSFLEF